MSDGDLAAIRAREQAATEGPWVAKNCADACCEMWPCPTLEGLDA